MIYFICWAVFLAVAILSVTVMGFLESRGPSTGQKQSVAEEPAFDDVSMEDESFDDPGAVESFDEMPAGEFAEEEFAASDQAADDFAAFDQEFK